MAITIYFIATSLPDRLASIRDALLLKHPSELTIEVLESALNNVESNLRSVASASGVVPPPLFHGCTIPQLPTFTASLATATTDVTVVAVMNSSQPWGKSGRRDGQGVGGGGGGGGGDVASGDGGSAGAGGAPRAAAGDSPAAASGGDARRQQHRQQPLPSQQPQQQQQRQQQVSGQGLGQRQLQRGVVHPPCTYHVLTGARRGQPCGRSHPLGQCFAQLTNTVRLAYGVDDPAPNWLPLVQTYSPTLWGMSASQLVDLLGTPHAMYAVVDSSASNSVYSSVVSLGASLAEVPSVGTCVDTSPGAAPEDASLPFTLDSRASHCFSPNRTTLTLLPRPVAASPQVAVSSQVPVSGPVAASCSCRSLAHPTVLWHHRMGQPSVSRLRAMSTVFTPTAGVGILAGFCREQGIHQSWTLPESPQQNGVAKRRIGLVMEIARTSMTHARAPHFLWPYAVWYAAHQLNLWPCVSRPEVSPTSLWTGSPGAASHSRVWGCLALVHDTSADKISPCTVPYVFLGFLEDSSGYTFHHPPLHQFLDSRYVRFDESIPYYPPPPGPAPSGVSPPPSVAPQVQPPSTKSSSQPTLDPAGAGFRGEDPGGASSRGAGVGAESVHVRSPGSGGAGVGAEPVTAGDSSLWGAGVSGAVPRGALLRLGVHLLLDLESLGRTLLLLVVLAGPEASGLLESGPGATTALDTTPPPHPCPTRHQTRPEQEQPQQQEQQQPPQLEEQRLQPQQEQQQQPHPPPVSGLWTLGLPSPSPPSPPSPPVSGPLLPPPDPSLAIFPPPLAPLSPPLSYTWPLCRSPHARPSSPVPFTDLRTALFCSNYYRTYRLVLSRVLASLVTDPRASLPFVSPLSAAVTEFASTRCLDYATSLVASPTSPLAVGGEFALGCDALEDRQFELEFLAAASPHLCAMLLAPEGDPDTLDIPTPRLSFYPWHQHCSTILLMPPLPPPRLFEEKKGRGGGRRVGGVNGKEGVVCVAQRKKQTASDEEEGPREERRWWAAAEAVDTRATGATGTQATGATDTLATGVSGSMARRAAATTDSRATGATDSRAIGATGSRATKVAGFTAATPPQPNPCEIVFAAAKGGLQQPLPLPDTLSPQHLCEWVIQRARPGGGGFGFLRTAQRWQLSQQETFSPQLLSELVSQRFVPSSVEAAALGASESAAAPGASESAAALGARASTATGLHLPEFSTNLLSNAVLQDAWVDTFIPGGQREAICTCSRTGRHLATFTRQPGSGLYTLTTASTQTLLWHHRLGHPSLPRLRSMHSRLLVSGLPRSLPSLSHSPAPSCVPCVEGRQRAAPHSSDFSPTTAPL
ncbi:unnamed protein product [Closterium sp. NIES-54]